MRVGVSVLREGSLCLLLVGVVWYQTVTLVAARTWKDIELLHGLSPPPFNVDVLLDLQTEKDPLDPFVFVPTSGKPVAAPTASPALQPTLVPSTKYPTWQPTDRPQAPPTRFPTQFPTSLAPTSPHPSSRPSSQPSEEPDPYPFNEPPLFPNPWYFNYDTRPNARYGPGYNTLKFTNAGFSTQYENNQWANSDRVDVASDPDFYWTEFDSEQQGGSGPWMNTLANHLPTRNQCGRVGLQSPINVEHNGLGECEETHEIRSRVRGRESALCLL